MLPYADLPSAAAARRPQVIDRGHDDQARWFTLRFEPHQRFPDHRNAATITLRALSGDGVLERGPNHRVELFPGHVVALRPSELHSVTAGADGLSLRVTLPVDASCVVQAGADALPASPCCEIPAPPAAERPAAPSCETRAAPSCECC